MKRKRKASHKDTVKKQPVKKLQNRIIKLEAAIAEHKKKVEDLSRLATVVSDSNDAVIMHDFEGKILAWNRGAKEIYGYTEAEALGKNVRDIVAGEDREAALELIQKIKHGEVVKSFELRRTTKDGKILDIWLTTTLLTDEKGKPVAIATTERDITERKKAEVVLKKKVEDLRLMAAAASESKDAVIMCDLKGNILSWNRGAEETYGYTKDEALEKNVIDIAAETDREAMRALIQRIKQGETGKSFELRRVTKDGRILNVWLTAALLPDEKGKPEAIATTERDVTKMKKSEIEMKQAYEKLKETKKVLWESEEKFRGAFEQSAVGIAFQSKEGKFLGMNKRYCDIIGYTEDELMNLISQEITFHEDLENDINNKKLMLEGKIESYIAEKRYIKKDKTLIWVKLSVSFVKNPDKSPKYFIAIVEDISASKEDEKKLLESEEKFRGAFEQSAMGMAFVSIEGRFIKVNKRYCEITGYPQDELLNMRFKDITYPDDIEIGSDGTRLMQEGKINEFKAEKRYIRKDKSLVWCSISIAVIRGKDNKPKYTINVTEDITARREAEERWKAFSDAFSDKMLLVDKNLKFLAANKTMINEYEKITDRKMKIGDDIPDTLNVFEDSLRHEKLLEVMKTGEPLNIDEYIINVKNQEPRSFSLKVFKVGDGLGLIISDITEMKRSEIILKQGYEKLKEIDRQKSGFIAIISHELRTPLTVIKGFMSFLMKGAAGTLSPQQKEFLTTIGNNTDRLELIVNDMVDISRIEANVFSLTKENYDIINVVADCVKDMEFISSRSGINIVKKIEIDSAIMNIDRHRMAQAIINVLNNAIKFSEKKSEVIIGIKEADVDKIPDERKSFLPPDKKYVVIYIKDKGPGIQKKYLDMIFDRFFQVEDYDHRKHGGTGLGLSIAKNIIESHDGIIWAESEGSNKGTVFNILLPLELKLVTTAFKNIENNAIQGGD